MKNNSTSKIARDIINLKKENSYTEFSKNFFKNVPELQGYLFKFDHLKELNIYLLVNTNPKFRYPKKYININKYNFIIYNSKNLEDFLNNLSKNLSSIIEILKKLTKDNTSIEKQKEGGLPYGYFEDKNGKVQVDPKKASEVRQIFKLYYNVRSIKKVAQQLNTNFSHIHDVLHDSRYTKMDNIIIPQLDLKRVNEILFVNRKNKER